MSAPAAHAAGLALLASVLALYPVAPSPTARLVRLRAAGHASPWRWGAVRQLRVRPARRHALALAGLGCGLGGWMVAGFAVAVAGAVAAVVATGAALRASDARRARRDVAAVIEAAEALAGDLRAGRGPAEALRSGAVGCVGPLGPILRAAASVASLGGQAGDVLAEAASGRAFGRPDGLASGPPPRPPRGPPPGLAAGLATGRRRRGDTSHREPSGIGYRLPGAAEGLHPGAASSLRQVAAGWEVSRRSGAPLAEVLESVAEELRAAERRRADVTTALSGPRTSAALLAALPLVGLGLGAAMGAHPVTVLTSTALGQAALIVGSVLDGVGVWVTARIVRTADCS
ncbi:MAG: type II secretion system F family protein [Mycobacteriales bacterium]|nr:MAG: hypothetical protein DLM56_14445 [Pseudonocardiales bacterium]